MALALYFIIIVRQIIYSHNNKNINSKGTFTDAVHHCYIHCFGMALALYFIVRQIIYSHNNFEII